MAAGEHAGHRARLDEKAGRMGFEFLEEHEQLEKILFVAVPQGNTNPMAHRLLEQCGSLYGVLTADVEELVKVPGVGRRTAQYLHDLFPLLGCVERCMLQEGKRRYPCLRTAEEMGAYAKTMFYGKLVECFYMISLNQNHQAFRFDKLSEGTLDETPVYVRETVKAAIRTTAKYVVIAHNHPGRTLIPSSADTSASRLLYAGLDTVGIELLDHIIVSHGEFISLRQMGVF